MCPFRFSLLFFYDIFFVFLTPYLTSNGDSIMVEVATGGSGREPGTGGPPQESLPMVLRVPHIPIGDNGLSLCMKSSYSLLGFGDILVPGLLVSYCHAFDIITGSPKRLYFVVSSIFYGLGMIATFFGLYLMNGIPQPALLYLVPFTLLPPIIISLVRGEFKLLWSGPEVPTQSPRDKLLEGENSSTSARDASNGNPQIP